MKKINQFSYACPHCGVKLDFDGDPRGDTYQCPDCSSAFTIPNSLKMAKKAKAPKGCYFMGLFLGIVGILVAHMTNGPSGAKEALRGFIFQVICVITGFFAFFVLPNLILSIR